MAIRTENHDDLTQFGNRLWALMSKNGYDTPRKLAIALFDAELVTVNSKPNGYTTDEEIRKNAIGSVEKKIAKHLHTSAMTNVQGEYIVAYCSHFNCSADYLFGYTDVQSGDTDIRNACKVTGLSEQAILQLFTALDEETGEATFINKCWSHLLESELFHGMPFDWDSAYHEAVEYLKCKAAVEAISEVLEDEDPSSFAYNTVAMKEKTINKAGQGHYAAYYGMLYKLAQNISTSLNLLVEQQTIEDKVFENELKQMKWQFQVELCKINGKPAPPKPDGAFRWKSHIIT